MQLKNPIELLAPGGDTDSIKAAILAGADAIYCGLDKFNARNRAKNIDFNDLNGILRLAHKNHCEVFLTLNIIIVESEIPALFKLLNKLVNTSIDGIIVQDLGLLYLLNKYFPSLKIHASTQLTTHNEGQVKFLQKLNVSRVNLSRELNIQEITRLTAASHEQNVDIEVFVHGSNCISFSGLCYMSSVHGGNSGNRGRCSQPCRDQYLTTAEGKDFPLNIKDNSAFSDLEVLHDAGVDSIKIEGRIKKYHYVYTVVDTWRKQLQGFYQENKVNTDQGELRKVFNRDFSDSFLQGTISKDSFIDNPRDNSAIYLADIKGGLSDNNLSSAKRELYDQKTDIINHVKEKIDKLDIERGQLTIQISGKAGEPLNVSVCTPESSFTVVSQSALRKLSAQNINKAQKLDEELFSKRFKNLNDTEYVIQAINIENLPDDLIIPFREITAIKNQILLQLNNSNKWISPLDFPVVEKHRNEVGSAHLSVLISSIEDVQLCSNSSVDIYFQLPNNMSANIAQLLDLFNRNSKLIPWFPSILIGQDYDAAVEFLHHLKPQRIVTNNIGIAYEASQHCLDWVAGPYLNLVNSFSFLCLKEKFNCSGAFVSNEINKNQITRLKKPDNFEFYYSIYHPVVLMTTRVCIHHQVTGCKKNIVDDSCIQKCQRSSSITNLKDVSFFIDKGKGDYHCVYNDLNYLNTEVINDVPNLFSSFFIDLRNISTSTRVKSDKQETIRLFESLLNGQEGSDEKLRSNIAMTTNTQYKKGI